MAHANCLKNRRSFCAKSRMSGISNKIMASRSIPKPNASQVHFVAAIRGAGRDYADRWRRGFHRPDLHSRSMRSKQTSIRQIKCVLLVARRMFGRRVEGVETMPFGLNVRAVRKGETHSTEDS